MVCACTRDFHCVNNNANSKTETYYILSMTARTAEGSACKGGAFGPCYYFSISDQS